VKRGGGKTSKSQREKEEKRKEEQRAAAHAQEYYKIDTFRGSSSSSTRCTLIKKTCKHFISLKI